MLKREYDDLTIEFCDFHFFDKDEFPQEINFCFLVLKDGSYTAGEWWPTNNGTGRFIRGTADSVQQDEVAAWLNLNRWNILEAPEDEEVNCIRVGKSDEYCIKISGFHPMTGEILPQNGQYCLILLKDGHMSGGRWEDGGPYLKQPGFFNHAPAACIIDYDEALAWAPLDPDREIPEEPEPEPVIEKKKRPSADPKIKFRYGYDINVYLEKAFNKLKSQYHWADRKQFDKHYRFKIEDINGTNEYVEYYNKTQTVLDYIENAEEFIDHVAWIYDYCVSHANKEVAEYRVEYEPREMNGWNLEHYIFYKLETGDFKVDVQAGDRTTGANREFYIPPDYLKAKTYSDFLDRYQSLVPGGPFGLYKEDLINDAGLMKFLGFSN